MINHYNSFPTLQPSHKIDIDGVYEYSYLDRYIYKDYDKSTHTYCNDTLLNEQYEKELRESTTLLFPELSDILRRKWARQYDDYMGL